MLRQDTFHWKENECIELLWRYEHFRSLWEVALSKLFQIASLPTLHCQSCIMPVKKSHITSITSSFNTSLFVIWEVHKKSWGSWRHNDFCQWWNVFIDPVGKISIPEGSDSSSRFINCKPKNHHFWSDAESKMLSNWLKKEQGQRRERAITMRIFRMLETRCLDP